MYLLALIGCASTGVIYTAVGVIAILSFLKVRHGGADESSFLAILDQFGAGRLFIWLIIAGTVGFIIWRLFEAFRDPYGYGRDFDGMVKRTGAGLSSGADAFIVFSAIQALYGGSSAPLDGEPVQQRKLAAELLAKPWGEELLFAAGAVICITALVLIFYVLSKSFTERIDVQQFSTSWRKTIHSFAYAGYFARSIILGIIGFFFMQAAIKGDSSVVVNTDKAFDFIGDHIGHVYFILVAAGTICYGLYMFISGWYYDTDKG